MIRKEWKRMLALSMTYIMTLSVAAPVKAAEEELGVPTAETAAEVQETPEQFEARTGYHLTEGYTYVLNNGFVILQADGSPQNSPRRSLHRHRRPHRKLRRRLRWKKISRLLQHFHSLWKYR